MECLRSFGGDLRFICHHLNVNPSVNPFITPKKQPPRRSSKDHFDAIKDEVMKLKHARAIKDVFYPEWLPTLCCKEEKWKVAGMCRLHRSEQGLPKRSFPHALDRLAYGCHYRSYSDEFFGHFSRLPPDTFGFG